MKRSLFLLALLICSSACLAKPALKCKADGTFKIVMFSDTQDDETLDPRTTALMEKILDEEKPDLVVIAGDCISGGDCATVGNVKQAISQFAGVMEKRKIPWAIVFGNHDQEHYARTHMGKDEVLEFYASFPCNLNVRGDTSIHGVGNDDLLIKDHWGEKPVFVSWLIDSGEYANGGYDWIHADQVAWYHKTSKALESKFGRKIPGIMFFHIPLQEFGEMYAAGKVQGDRFEPEAPSKIHSALFAAILQRGDVKGIFCGHDHVNNYIGEWKGVRLGYDGAVGYGTYNLPDSDPNHVRTRGGRVFLIKESDPWHFETWMCHLDGSKGP